MYVKELSDFLFYQTKTLLLLDCQKKNQVPKINIIEINTINYQRNTFGKGILREHILGWVKVATTINVTGQKVLVAEGWDGGTHLYLVWVYPSIANMWTPEKLAIK